MALRLRATNYSSLATGMKLALEGNPASDGCVRWVRNIVGIWYIEVSPSATAELGPDFMLFRFSVEVQNGMSMPTDIHWHAMLPPNGQDGVGYITERPIKPHETREYNFEQAATGGLYWVHAHFEFQDAQGLAAPLIMKSTPAQLRALGNPIDVLMEVEDRFPYNYCAYSPFLYPEHCVSVPQHKHRTMVHFLNRAVAPVVVSVKPGDAVRLRVVNIGSEAPWVIDVSLLGHAEVLALDGNDLVRNGLLVMNKTITTGQRVDLLVKIPAGSPPSCYPIRAVSLSHRSVLTEPPLRGVMLSTGGQCPGLQPFWNGSLAPPVAWQHDDKSKAKHPIARRPVDVSYTLKFGGDQYGGFWMRCPAGLTDAQCGQHKWGLPPYAVFMHNVTRQIVHSRRPCEGCETNRYFNDSGLIDTPAGLRCWEWSETAEAECPSFKPYRVVNEKRLYATQQQHEPLYVCKGQRVEVELVNAYGIESNEGHPIHLHGHTFEVRRVEHLEADGTWRVVTANMSAPHDTVHVPWGYKVVIHFDANNPGTWLLHCHNTFHIENGMLTMVVYREDWHPHCRQTPKWTGNV